MRIIDTTQIVDPNVEQPLLGPSVDFLTQNQLETLSSIVLSLIGPAYSASQVYVLNGCVVTGVTSGAGNFAMTAGAIFFGGEIYQVAAFPTTAVGGGNTVYSALNSAGTGTDPYDNVRTLDPVTFSDGSTKSVHLTRTWLPAIGASGSNPVSGWIYPFIWQTNTVQNGDLVANGGGSFTLLGGNFFYKLTGETVSLHMHIRGTIAGTVSSMTYTPGVTLPSNSTDLPFLIGIDIQNNAIAYAQKNASTFTLALASGGNFTVGTINLEISGVISTL